MSVPRARRGPGRWSPQTFRARFTLVFAALFLIVGAALLGITYSLVAGLPVKVPQVTSAQAKLAFTCKSKAGSGKQAEPFPSRNCLRAFARSEEHTSGTPVT